MSSVLRPVRKRKKSRTLGLQSMDSFAGPEDSTPCELELDAKR